MNDQLSLRFSNIVNDKNLAEKKFNSEVSSIINLEPLDETSGEALNAPVHELMMLPRDKLQNFTLGLLIIFILIVSSTKKLHK